MKWLIGLLLGIVLFLPGMVIATGDEHCCSYDSYLNGYLCYGDGNCTWWARYMRPDLNDICTCNAGLWLVKARAAEFPTDTWPQPGSVAVFENMGGYGHVAYVLAVESNGRFYVSEMAYGNDWSCVRFHWYNRTQANGFILFKPGAANLTVACQKIAECRSRNSWLGSATSNCHEWHPSGGNGRWVYIRDYQYGSIVFDAVGGASKAYAINSYMLNCWAADRGCAGSNFGCPIGEKYAYSGGYRIDGQYGYIFQKNGFSCGPIKWNGDRYGPGTFKGASNQPYVVNPLYSYKIGDCFSRNGGQNRVGKPANGGGNLPYAHPIGDFSAIGQDFSGGSWVNVVLLYDTQAQLPRYQDIVRPYCPSPNTPNQACELHGAIRSYWETHNRFTGIGYPFTDEITVSGHSYTVKQHFIKRQNGLWIGTVLRYYPNGSVTQHNLFNQGIAPPQDPDISLDLGPDGEESITPSLHPVSLLVTPNPTTAGCTIHLNLPVPQTVELSVFDVSGRRVKLLVPGEFRFPGQHTLTWDGRDEHDNQTPMGIYYLRLVTPNERIARPITVVR